MKKSLFTLFIALWGICTCQAHNARKECVIG